MATPDATITTGSLASPAQASWVHTRHQVSAAIESDRACRRVSRAVARRNQRAGLAGSQIYLHDVVIGTAHAALHFRERALSVRKHVVDLEELRSASVNMRSGIPRLRRAPLRTCHACRQRNRWRPRATMLPPALALRRV